MGSENVADLIAETLAQREFETNRARSIREATARAERGLRRSLTQIPLPSRP